MKQKITLLITLLLVSYFGQAQTTLATGDLSIIGVNGNGADGFAFVSWVDLAANTVINFSDNGFNNSASSTTTGNYRQQEQYTVWTNNTGNTIVAGTIITIQANSATPTTSVTNIGTITSVTNSTNGTTAADLTLTNTSGDQVFAFQGTLAYSGTTTSTFSGTLLAGLGYSGSTGTATGWVTTGAINGSTSYLPSDLSGTSQIFLGPNIVGGQYTGPTSGLSSLAAYKAQVSNPANWTTVGTTGTVTFITSTGATFTGGAAPTVTTTAATAVGSLKATLGGNVTADGGATVTEKGIVWATTANPTTSDTKVTNGIGTGSFSAIISSLPAGTLVHFRAYAINSVSTSYGSDLTFTTNAALSATTSQVNLLCNNISNGSASVTASGGVTSYTYSWAPSGGSGATASNLASGSYTCTITDSESTQIIKNFTLTQPTAVSGTTVVTNVACFGGSTAAINLTPTGGTGPYTFNWGGGVTSEDRTNLVAGAYSVTITDVNGCTGVVNVTVTQPTAVSGTTVVTNVACFGGSTAAINLTPTGGVGFYTFNWGGGVTSEDRISLAAGAYSVTITDANGCTGVVNVTVTQPASVVSGTTVVTNVACFGGSTAAINLTPTGGTGPYTFNWGGGVATEDRISLVAGDYSVTITDVNGCTGVVNVTVTQPAAALSAATGGGKTDVSCFGGSNGTATVAPTGGTPGYTYSWAPSGGTGATATGLAAGTYTLTVTDANSCQTTRSYTISQPTAALSATTGGGKTDVSCFGGSNGTATVAPTGGTPGYTYSWAPSGGTGATASGLTAGTYTVTVTDANSCQTTQSFTITEPNVLVATASAQTNVSCNSGSNGTATVNVTGGTSGYTYSWAPSGGTAATATGLTAGTYTVMVTDANLCSTTQSFTITEPTVLLATAGAQTNVSCNLGSNGSATVSTTGGTGAYTYSWAPSGGTAATATGLTAGTYTVTVTDANFCSATQSFTITEPTALVATAGAQTNVSCNSGSNGSATVSATGGTPGYTYSWAPSGGTAATATGLSAGTYTVTVTDANSCQTTQSFTITEPNVLVATASAQTNISCNSGSNGTATVNVTGGTSGYTYSWAPSGGTAATATGLTAGTYTVMVTDANLCSTTQTFTITEPTVLLATAGAQTNVSCNLGSNGSATVSTTGGAGAYTYSWAPSGGTAATATGLTAGTYTVTVTDANFCSATQSFTITEPTALVATAGAQTNVSCNSGSNGSATVSTTGGTGTYTYSWAPSGGTAATATGLTAGTYTVTVTDANLCSTTQTFTITEPTVLLATAGAQTNVSCNSGSNGSATVSATGGTPGYTYSWAPSGGTGATATGLTAGTYTVMVTDANLCSTTQSFTITEPTALSFTTTTLPEYDYNTVYNQTIIVTGGTGTKTYVVSTGSLPSGFNLLSNGTITGTSTQVADSNFTITATDANNCTNSQAYILKLSQIPITITATSSQTKVYGESDPVLTYSATPNLLPGDSFSGSLDRVAGENIGNYAISQGSLSAGSKYLIIYVGADFTITAKPITVTADALQTKVYGTTDPVFTYSVSPSLVSGDAFTGSLDRVSGENVGSYSIGQGTLDAGSNYTVSYVADNLAITAKDITVTADASQAKVYGTADSVFTYSVSPSLESGDSFTGSLDRVSGENVGTYSIGQGTLDAGLNYTVSYVADNFAITPKPITVTADALQTKVYGTVDPTFTYSVSPSLVSGDTFTGSLDRVSGENVGTYSIGQGTLDAGLNYTVSYVADNFAITVKPITVTADALQTKVYGTVDPAFTYSVSPSLVSGDSFTGSLDRVSGENVGSYAIGQGTLDAGLNYTVSYVADNFAITAKPITVTADASQAKVYGTVDPTFTYSVSPSLVSGDAFTGSLDRVVGENVGSYSIGQGTLDAGLNYTVSYVADNFAITAKPITVTADASQAKVYGTVDPAFTYSVSPSLVSGDAFTGSLDRVVGENVGSYSIGQGTLDAGLNYIVSYVADNFAITAKPITVTADALQTKVYGTVDPAFTYSVSPSLVSGDTFTGSLDRVSGENVGSYSIGQGTLDAGLNYTVSYVADNFAITVKPITVTADALQTKVYGTIDPILAYSVSPSLVNGDSFTGSLDRVSGENVGSYSIGQGTLTAGLNYSIVYSTANFSITKANQSITWSQTLELGCDGETTVILTATSDSNLPVSYFSSNTDVATISDGLLIFENYGSTTITASQVGDNNYNASQVVVLPVVNSQPNLIRKQFEDVIFFDNSSKEFKAFTWYKNGVLVPGQTLQYFKETGALNGTYYAVVTKLDGTLITTCPLILSPTVEEEYIKIAPNPVNSNSSYELITNVDSARMQNAHIEVFGVNGSLLDNKTTSENTTTLISPNVEGIYIVRLTLANGKSFTKNLLVKN